MFLPSLDYCDVVWNCNSEGQATKLEKFQNYADHVILRKLKSTSATWVRNQLSWPTLRARRKVHLATMVFKSINILILAIYIAPLLRPSSDISIIMFSTSSNLHLTLPSSNFWKEDICFPGISTMEFPTSRYKENQVPCHFHFISMYSFLFQFIYPFFHVIYIYKYLFFYSFLNFLTPFIPLQNN